MKIGILTHPVRCNYGGALQAYALQCRLKEMGYETEIIDLHRPTPLLSRTHHWVERNVFHRRFTRFARQYMQRTPRIRKQSDLQRITTEYDAVIVGSDQVWRLSMVHGLERNYFLDFTPDKCRRVAYAASFGLSDLESCNETLYNDIKALVSRFDAVSVREVDGVEICRRHWNIKATQVLDPTLLAGRNIFDALANRANPSRGTLFYYFLGDKGAEVAQLHRLAHVANRKTFTVNAGRTLRISKFAFAFYPPVEQWVRAFRDAEIVITDSFHGVCFALLYNKPFYVISNRSGGVSRITSLLHLLGLDNRFVNTLDTFKTFEQLMAHSIDFTPVNDRLARLRADSENFLFNALKQ